MLRLIGIVLFLALGGWCFMLFNGDGNLAALGGCIVCALLVLWLLFRAVFKKRRTVTDDSDGMRVTRGQDDSSYRGNRR